MQKLSAPIVLALFVALACATKVSAAATSSQSMFRATTTGERIENRCAMLETKIDTRVSNYNTVKENHLNVYNNTVDRVKKLLEKLNGQGYDVTKLNTDVSTFQDKIVKFGQDYDAYIQKLTDTKGNACGASSGKFVSSLSQAKKGLTTVHKDAMDVRNYFVKTIKKDLLALKEQKKDQKKTATTSPASSLND